MLDFSKLLNNPQHNIQISVSHTTKTYLIKRLLELICLNEIWGNMHGWYRRVLQHCPRNNRTMCNSAELSFSSVSSLSVIERFTHYSAFLKSHFKFITLKNAFLRTNYILIVG